MLNVNWTSNKRLASWVKQVVDECMPDSIHICDGSDEEYRSFCQLLVDRGTFVPLKRPRSFWCHSSASDVARLEEATFICSKNKKDAGPTNNWRDPDEMKDLLKQKFKGCMRGRVLYVIPFCMGPLGSEFSRIGVELTDSPYVVCNMHLMTCMGKEVLDQLKTQDFIPCLHSVGKPLSPGEEDSLWPCNEEKYIAHFPEEKSIISFGSGYGGNALLGKKCLALRIASWMGREEGWLAEHMLIMGVTSPEGKKYYIAAAFPSACGKTNLAMLKPALPGWKVECVGDDIAWIRIGSDGRLYAVNPERGFFGVAPGTSWESNPHAMQAIQSDAIFTNVALTDERDVWWEGMTKEPPEHLTNWKGESWTKGSFEKASHPNGRFTVSIEQCPILDPAFDSPEGVPLSAIIFGGRRSSTTPLIYEAKSWAHGVLLGASLSSEMTAAAKGEVGKLRHDPFAMLPFCGYNMGDYFAHWLEMGKKTDPQKLPKIFHANWFLKDEEGNFLWPGFGDNIRAIKWIIERLETKVPAQETSFGYLPHPDHFDLERLQLSSEAVKRLFSVDPSHWKEEVEQLRSYFSLFGDRFPKELAALL